MTVRLIGFDLDDTLWAMKPILINAENRLNDWLRVNCQALRFDVTSMRKFGRALLEEQPLLAADVSELRRRVIERALLASEYPARKAAALSEAAFDVFLAERNNVTYFAGALESLKFLSQRFSLAALTNGNADIARLGLDRYFSFSLSAADVGAPKPAPALFLAALERAGVKAEQMVYVGDDPANDIHPANVLGIRTVWVDMINRQYQGETEPTATVRDLHELPLIIARLNK